MVTISSTAVEVVSSTVSLHHQAAKRILVLLIQPLLVAYLLTMSAWKLVEAVPDQAPVENNVAKDSNATGQTSDNRNGIHVTFEKISECTKCMLSVLKFKASNGRGGGRGSRDGGRGGRGRGNRPQMTKADRTYTAYMAVQQM